MQRHTVGIAGIAILASLAAFATRAAPEASSSFRMEDASVLEIMDQVPDLSRGRYAPCGETSSPEVKGYPDLASDNPCYGVLHLPGPAGTPAADGIYFVVDESGGAGKGYDRLYIDLDRDLDLAEETPLEKTPPPASARRTGVEEVYFETGSLLFLSDAGAETSVEAVPRLLRYEGRPPYMTFLQAGVKKGTVTIEGREYLAVLGHPYSLSDRLDTPDTGLFLVGEGMGQHGWWGRDDLKAVRTFNDSLYAFSASPSGDELTVARYDGEMGIFRVGPGRRELEGEVTARGSLSSPERNVALGGAVTDGWPELATECRVPAGDYYPRYLRVRFGPLDIFLSNNYHGRGGATTPEEPVRGIRIRPDTPFVFDFSNAPEVFFSRPSEGQVIKAGSTASVAAVLVDPELDVMIRGLDDTRRKIKKEYPSGMGETQTVETDVSLDPRVLITRADGERVVEGVMPFG